MGRPVTDRPCPNAECAMFRKMRMSRRQALISRCAAAWRQVLTGAPEEPP